MDTAADIMKLTAADLGRVFGADRSSVSASFRSLAKRWHPDRNDDPAARDAFAHLSDLHRIALKAAEAGHGREPTRRFALAAGGSVEIGASRTRPVDHGEVIVGRDAVSTLVRPDLADLADAARSFVPRFPDERMRMEMERFLPRAVAIHDTTEGTLFVHGRTRDQCLLRDLHGFLGAVDQRHAAWMISSMENLACWMEWAGIVHGDVGFDTLLVSPEFHSVALVGPFLFATPTGTRPKALPARTLDTAPRMTTKDAVADHRLDLDLIRLTAAEALRPTDPARKRPPVEPSLESWLASPPSDSPRADYAAWQKARDAAFGPPKFIPLDVDMDVVDAA